MRSKYKKLQIKALKKTIENFMTDNKVSSSILSFMYIQIFMIAFICNRFLSVI